MSERPGLVVLFGSGETSPSGRRVFDWVLSKLPPPIRLAILETPAGFQPNSARVAEDVADFVRHRLQNHDPEVAVVPARRRGTPFSPDNPDVLAPLVHASAIFLGPGSPTYAVRQLQDSLAWHTMQYRQRRGAAIVLASAATIAASRHALPVYEIYKVGEDLHWRDGLDFFGPFGLSLVFVPHWNNAEGGADLDTSRCFMGQVRFEQLVARLPEDITIVGIDEHTALVFDIGSERCHVMGKGGVTLLQPGRERRFVHGQAVAMGELGRVRTPEADVGIDPGAVEQLVAAATAQSQVEATPEPPSQVVALADERESYRARRDWAAADALRERIAALGWRVTDTPQGPRLEPEQNGTGQ